MVTQVSIQDNSVIATNDTPVDDVEGSTDNQGGYKPYTDQHSVPRGFEGLERETGSI